MDSNADFLAKLEDTQEQLHLHLDDLPGKPSKRKMIIDIASASFKLQNDIEMSEFEKKQNLDVRSSSKDGETGDGSAFNDNTQTR